MRDVALLSPADFQPLIGAAFAVVEGNETAVELRLTEVVILAERPGHRQPFSLRLVGPQTPLLEQATHRLLQAEMGTLDLFFGPTASGPAGTTYEVIFG
jgi:hypothetical protein